MSALSDLLAIPEAQHRTKSAGKRVIGGDDERTIQRAIVKSLRKLGLRVHHSPNGAHLAGSEQHRRRQMAALKADGLEPGFYDLIVIRPRALTGTGCADFGFLEVKRPGGMIRNEQLDFGQRCDRDGVKSEIVWSLDMALDALRKWGWL